MGSKYPVLPPQKIIKVLEKNGFRFASQKGSHMKYVKNDLIVIVPNHDEVAKGTLKSILAMAHIDLDDFLKEL